MSIYSIGIDLGTSNSALAYIRCDAKEQKTQILPIIQRLNQQAKGELLVLPSYLALARSEYETMYVGEVAREELYRRPHQVISSAKSWLCHAGVNRREKILPWGDGGELEDSKLTPMEASAAYLRYLRTCWQEKFLLLGEEHGFDAQDITITVPASFDEVARELTLEAARLAGYPAKIKLQEEPQAAFYYWLQLLRNDQFDARLFAEEQCKTVLVIDIGGGTSDFSLFSMQLLTSGEPVAKRLAVGEHLLLGGDNIDLALAHAVEKKLGANEQQLTVRQWGYLVHTCKRIKEEVFSSNSLEYQQKEKQYYLSIPDEGARLFTKTITSSLSYAEIREIVLDGFFPLCGKEELALRRKQGLVELGLPYAYDSAISRHLAGFVRGTEIDAVLFTGGSLTAEVIRERIVSLIASWQEGQRPYVLENPYYDLAVAHGASYYGYLNVNKSFQVESGYGHSLYLRVQGADDKDQALCVLEQGAQAGTKAVIERAGMEVLTDRPVRFELLQARAKRTEKAGEVVPYVKKDFLAVAPLETQIDVDKKSRYKGGQRLPVKLEVGLNELGALEVYCVANISEDEEAKWKLNFSLRAQLKEDEEEELLEEQSENIDYGVPIGAVEAALSLIESVYTAKGKEQQDTIGPKSLFTELENVLGPERKDWNTQLLRALWPALTKTMTRKGKSIQHEQTWLTLAGFVLRPGFGAPLDQWRISELWRLQELGLSFPRESAVQVQSWVMWRRLAGGLGAEEQAKLFEKLEPVLAQKKEPHIELIRLLASLERLNPETKDSLARRWIRKIKADRGKGVDSYINALGHMGSRILFSAEHNCVLSPHVVMRWFKELASLDWKEERYAGLNHAFSLCARLTGDKGRDLEAEDLKAVYQKLCTSGAKKADLELLEGITLPNDQFKSELFGESLPLGIYIG